MKSAPVIANTGRDLDSRPVMTRAPVRIGLSLHVEKPHRLVHLKITFSARVLSLLMIWRNQEGQVSFLLTSDPAASESVPLMLS